MNLDRLWRDWERWKVERDNYSLAAESVKIEILRVAEKVGIRCSASGRAKTPSEFQKKAIRKQDNGYLEDPWGKTTDKAGVRAIVDFESELKGLFQALQQYSTLILGEPNDNQLIDPKVFDYRGLHVQVESVDYPGIECELQIRTSAQHLWSSVVSHRFLYKPLVDIPWPVQRPLYRLVSLMELFDAEVERAMAEIKNLPEEYALFELLEIAERQFLTLTVRPESDKKLSLLVLGSLLKTIPSEELPSYGKTLSDWVTENQTGLEVILEQYGPQGGSTDPRYLLFSQPEIIVFLERLERAESKLENVWADAQLPQDYFDAINAVWSP